MAYRNIHWSRDDVKFDLVPEDSSESVVTIKVTVPDGILTFMGEPVQIGRTLVVRGTHVESRGIGPNGVGNYNLRLIAEVVMEEMDYDEIRVEGEVRTTGANPGRRPSVIRYARGRILEPRTGFERS
jgi:hypothetical protein